MSDVPRKRCSKCGEEKPATTDYFKKGRPDQYKGGLRGVCKTCESNAAKERRKDPDVKQHEREYREQNRERIKARTHAYYEANKQKAINQARQWRHKNRARYNAWRRKNNQTPENQVKQREMNKRRNQDPERREKNREYGRRYYTRRTEEIRERKRKQMRRRRKDPIVGARIREADRKRHKTANRQLSHKTYNQRRRARKQSLPDTLTTAQWKHCLECFGYRCAACGRPQGLWHRIALDHWIPLSHLECPGTVVANVIPLCHSKADGTDSCNNSKSNQDPHVWLIERFGKRKAAEILARITAYFNSLK